MSGDATTPTPTILAYLIVYQIKNNQHNIA
jgi:hypothetical protein